MLAFEDARNLRGEATDGLTFGIHQMPTLLQLTTGKGHGKELRRMEGRDRWITERVTAKVNPYGQSASALYYDTGRACGFPCDRGIAGDLSLPKRSSLRWSLGASLFWSKK